MKKLILIFILIIFILIFMIFFYEFKQFTKAEIIALKYPAQVEIIESKDVIRELKKSVETREQPIPTSYWYLLKITGKNNNTYYQFTEPERLFDFQNNVYFQTTPVMKKVLQKYLVEVEKDNPFGKLMTWEEVDQIFPRMAKAQLRDLETGLTLNIQRRAGSKHADVQPLTASDTKKLKQIYGDKWSWKRRAAILEKDGYKIATSMNGMPHGQGAIKGNDFPGHFCLHFYNTKTHSGNVNLAHQLMVWKAAGLIEDYLLQRSAEEMIAIALTAFSQNDPQLVSLSFVLNENISKLLNYMHTVASLKINCVRKGLAVNEFLVEIEWYQLDSGKNYEEKISLFVEKREQQYLVRPDELILVMGKHGKL